VAPDGTVGVAGTTKTSDGTFPVVGEGLGKKYGGGSGDAFAAAVAADGSHLIYSGFLGGSGDELSHDNAVDAAGNQYVCGPTTSSDFPVNGGPDLRYNGGLDAYITKIDPTGYIVYSGFLGGSGDDECRGVDVDSSGNAYLAGRTTSTPGEGFPVKDGPDLTYNGGFSDAFVAKVHSSGDALGYCGYIGGTSADGAWGVAVDPNRVAFVGGDTASTDFPVQIGPDLTYAGGKRDGFVTQVVINRATGRSER
jgi:hypothetical protein